jgi:hypothetical protein
VITSAAGYPLDSTFYQTIKGVTAAQHIVKSGGRILVLGECREGVGGTEFAEKLRQIRSYESYLDEIKSSPVEIDQWQLEKLALTGLHNELFFYAPGIPDSAMGALADRHYGQIDGALDAFYRGLPRGSRIAVVPEGPYAFAKVAVAAGMA